MRIQIQKRDLQRRILYKKCELARNILNSVLFNREYSLALRYAAYVRLVAYSRNTSITRIRNRCALTYKARGVYKFCRLSRLAFRALASQGLLHGIRKSSW